jgi:hypothetical protein
MGFRPGEWPEWRIPQTCGCPVTWANVPGMGHTVTATPPLPRQHADRTADDTLAARVAGNLRAILARHQIHPVAFGALMGWPKSTAWRRHSGQHPLTLDEVERAAAVLGITVGDLIGEGRTDRRTA